ncbi:hypothetical protein [Permianibacter aggregans]|uniref:Uncharacterized protein n=1 Tax=Permianibacter aggregans TaxID=1510150 RepID=A0A4R6UP95_9GAMM|nr:hypothetical protein [Permianibacter aggregans]QGX40156.1 hypothetical protein E2H98_10930 [Permianibacter aggregans]TDQ49028.1 hypothetical protein EV696_1052 [Permianibacter aggregans]
MATNITDSVQKIMQLTELTEGELASVLNIEDKDCLQDSPSSRLSADAIKRIDSLLEAVELLSNNGLATPLKLRRTIRGGQHFFHLVRDGGHPMELAQRLIEIHETERQEEIHLANCRARIKRKPD